MLTRRELRLSLGLGDHRFLSHSKSFFPITNSLNEKLVFLFEREAHGNHKCLGAFIVFSRGYERNVHTTSAIDLVVLDLGEDKLLSEAHGVDVYKRQAKAIAIGSE